MYQLIMSKFLNKHGGIEIQNKGLKIQDIN